jgi:hypothetical protein
MHSPSLNKNFTSNKYFLISFGLINTLALTLLICQLSFLAGLTIAKWQFPLACIIGILINFFACAFFFGEKAKKYFLKNCCVLIGSIVSFILISGFFYDASFDGQWYHQESVYNLKNGFNPVYQTLKVPQNQLYDDGDNCKTSPNSPTYEAVKKGAPPFNIKFLAMNNFSLGSEIMEASIYQLTGHIEYAKAINLMLFEAAFFLCLAFLYKLDVVSVPKKWLMAALFTFNPVSFMQLLTFCVDGNLGCLLLCLIAIAGLIFIESNNYYLIFLISSIALIATTKFTGIPFAGIYGLGFMVILLAYKKISTLKKVLITGVLAFTVGIVCCGFHPYVTNVIRKHELFYGLDKIKQEQADITPGQLKGRNRIVQLGLSLSTHQQLFSADKASVWQVPKIPFTFNKYDIYTADEPQQELSGFGPFFSGVVLFAIILLIVLLTGFRNLQVVKYGLLIFSVILITVLITPDSWWIRYIPQFWLLPSLVLFMASFIVNRSVKILSALLYMAFTLNVLWVLCNTFFNVLSTCRIDYQLKQLQALNKPILVSYPHCQGFRANNIRFAETGIRFAESNVSGTNVYTIARSSTIIKTPAPLPQIPKPFLLKMIERLFGKLGAHYSTNPWL